MKREIKFRVWNNNTNRYESKGFLTSSSETNKSYVLRGIMEFEQDDDDYFDDGENIVLQQYTGLKDKNGIERSEGDIIKRSTGYVFLEEKKFFSLGNSKSASAFGYDYHPEDEIIGNIHENPELL